MFTPKVIFLFTCLLFCGCNKSQESFEEKVNSNFRNFILACEHYQNEYGETLNLDNLEEVLKVLTGKNSKSKIFFDNTLIDPNGNPYLYIKNNLICIGKDGKLDTSDDIRVEINRNRNPTGTNKSNY